MDARRMNASALWLKIFPILSQPATATEPTDGALDNPTFGQNDEALGPIGTTDDFSDQVRHDVRQAVMNTGPA